VRLIIEARIEGAAAASTPMKLGVIERQDDQLTLSNLGLRLDEGRELLRRAQGSDGLGTGGILAGRPLDVRTMRSPVGPQRQRHELVSARMAKRRQMRWSEQGAHLLVQVRSAVLNGTLRPRERPIPWPAKAKNGSRDTDYEWELEAA
jgi:hypothetical protein